VFEAALAYLIERGSVFDVEYEMVRKDGSRLPVLVNATAIRDPEGNYVASRSTVLDLTSRKAAEETIRLFADTVNNVPIGLTICRLDDPADANSLRLVMANPAASALLGVNITALIGQTLPLAFPAISLSHLESFAKVIRSGSALEIGE